MRSSISAAVLAVTVFACRSAVPAQAASRGTFQTFANPGGGSVVTGLLGNQPSLQAATAAMLRHIHSDFGSRPTVIQTARNPNGHAIALLFSETRNGRPYLGISLVNAAPGEPAGGAVLYDTKARFASTIGPMLHRLESVTTPQSQPGKPVVLAPAEPLEHRLFTDGTGSIDLPADWKLLSGGGGSASAVGPTGEIVSYNLVLTAMDPSNPTGQNYLRNLPPQSRQLTLTRTAILPYTGDPEQAWNTGFRQLAEQNGRPTPSFSIAKMVPLGASQGLHLDELIGEGTIPRIPGKADDAPGDFVAFVQVTPPDPMGQWSMYSTFVFVPQSELTKQGNTAAAVFESVRIDFAAVAAQSAAIRNMFQKSFEAMMARSQAANAARQEQTDDFLANQAAEQEGMHKWAVSMENFAGDRQTVVNTTTGLHSTVSTAGASLLVYPGSEYQSVPPSELLKGVDY